MTIPASIYIAIGAAVAALITGWTSAANIIIAKDQKISEFRQKWIDELRQSTSELSCYMSMLSSLMHMHYEEKCGMQESEIDKIACKSFVKYYEPISLQITKIRLLLNPKDNKNIIDLLSSFENELENVSVNFKKTENIAKLLTNFETDVKDLLKSEWERVKCGEPDYIKFKKLSLCYPWAIFVLIIIAVLIAQFVKS